MFWFKLTYNSKISFNEIHTVRIILTIEETATNKKTWLWFSYRVMLLLQITTLISYEYEFLVTCQRGRVIMCFTACTFYCRVIQADHWLPLADLLALSPGEWDVPVHSTLEFTPRCLLCAAG